MPRLLPCPSCHSHVHFDERECPHCGGALRPSSSKVPMVLMGLALAGCPIDPGEPEYGVPDPTMDSSVPESEYGVPDTGDPMSTTGTAGTDTTGVGEPEYGVPDTSTSTSG